MMFQIKLGRLIEEEMRKDEAFGGVLDTLLTQVAMLIIQKSRGNKDLLNKLLEASSDHLFQRASLFARAPAAKTQRGIMKRRPRPRPPVVVTKDERLIQ